MINLLEFTLNVRKSHRQLNLTLQLVYEDRVLFVSVDLHVSLCWQQHTKCERAIRLVYPPLIRKLRPLHPTPQLKSNGVGSGDSNSCIWVTIQNYTHVCIQLFLTMTDIITAQITDQFS